MHNQFKYVKREEIINIGIVAESGSILELIRQTTCNMTLLPDRNKGTSTRDFEQSMSKPLIYATEI